jgi:hypothetical protein
VSSAGIVPLGDSRPGETRPRRRVLLLSQSAGLGAVLSRLLDRRAQLAQTAWSGELGEQGGLNNADLVLLDVPRAGRAAAFEQLRRCYRGPVVVFVERGDDGGGLPADHARTLLARPFSTDQLKAALGLPELGTAGQPLPAARRSRPGAAEGPATLAGKAPTLVAPPAGTGGIVSMFPPAGDDRAASPAAATVDQETAAPPASDAEPDAAPPETPRRNRRRLGAPTTGLVHGRRVRRKLRIAGFAGLAAVAFTVAFVLAAQGRCGPGCDALKGIITPVSTLPAVNPPATPTTSVRRLPPSTTLPPPGGGSRGAVPGGALGSTTSTTRRAATTTTRRPSATTRPAPTTTQPPTTTLLPTTTSLPEITTTT